MKKQMIVVALILAFVISPMTEIAAQATEGPGCYDSCSTGCVQRDARLMQRCDRKCQIRCSPDASVEERVG